MVQKDNRINLNEPLAIIGMNCRFPGIETDVEDCEALHAMLMNGQTPIKEVPANRWDINAYYDADRSKADKIISRKGGFLNNPYLFDADFFKISPVEAKQMDPQHRLFLEVAIRALNHANISTDSLSGSNTGVYCGLSTHEYSQLNFKDQIEFNEYTPVGVAASAAAGRLSHYLNLKGPTMAVDTACSSALSALYLAATALRTGQCDTAIVGGIHLNLAPENFIGVSRANMLSARGQCSSFDIEADGYVRSEGVAVIVVKRLDDALRDKDTVHAVIKTIVMNQDGGGISMVSPNQEAQIAMHRALLAEANIAAGDIDYIETHGTGTVVGDTVEFKAIEAVHQGRHSIEKPLIIGALKSNLGHSISCSGMASLLKVVCALENEAIPPNLHYSNSNKSIHPEIIPALLPLTALPFRRQLNKKRRVQITNFGFTGTNVSVLIEEAPEQHLPASANTELECFVLSANSEKSLKQMLQQYAAYLKTTDASLHDICLSLINCRHHYKYRCAILAKDKKSLIADIESANYALEKLSIGKDQRIVATPHDIYEQFMAGHNIKTADNAAYNKVNLPLYPFDRRHYYHEPRNAVTSPPIGGEPIAIIGMSCRFPKAPNLDEFLKLLEQGNSGMDFIPKERWDNDKFYDANIDTPGKLYVKQLGLLDNIKDFDANFFNISPREAKFMSPQLRIFMECSYHALEHANISSDLIKSSKTGVFVGIGTNEYPRIMENLGLGLEDLNIYFATGNVLNALAGRVAYSFDLHGPVQVIDTACSSSMTAIHNACLSLQAGDCSMAIAGGVNVILTPNSNITLSKAKMLSPDSRCKTFSEDADGYARSEGCGVIILKPLSAAIRDNDSVIAVIKGTATNSSGKSSGFTVPNGVAQEDVIRRALAKAKLEPGAIDYVEAHGTGTPLADPIEMNTLTRIFSASHSPERPLYVSSVKTNIGHSESASGVAGIIKAVLSLQNRRLFKHLNFKKLNPEIELNNTAIPLETITWPDTAELKHAGVSSFGFSGANAHAILGQAPFQPKPGNRSFSQEFLLVLSAKSQAALELLLRSYQHYLSQTQDEFADICYTAANCRGHYLFRTVIRACSAAEAAALIERQLYLIYPLKKEQGTTTTFHTIDHLQSAYQEGFSIDWQAYYQSLGMRFEKVKLPLYTFDRQEYWFEDKNSSADVSAPNDWSFQLQWQPQAIDQSTQAPPGGRWLLLGAKELVSGFKARGLNISLPEEAGALENWDGIIFAEGLANTSGEEINSLIEFQKNTLKSLLVLVKDLNARQIKPRLIILNHKGIAELDADPDMGNSPLPGFCKTLALELPQFESVLIDVDQIAGIEPLVINEITYNHSSAYEHAVAYRKGIRLVSRLTKSALPEENISLDPKARYLITGGLGGLGRVSAQALLAAGARHLILLARNLEKPGIKEALSTLRSAYPDSSIQAVSLDITDREKLKQLFLEVNADGLLKGIIHAAGVAVKASLLDHRNEDVDYQFSAKVKGGWYLHELSKDFKLDFFLAYSSISSVFGSNKESVYSATNSFIDALISHRRHLGLPATSIQWGPWGEAGMSIQRARDPGLKQALISNAQGQAFIRALLKSSLKQIAIISPEYLQFMLDFVPQPGRPLFYQSLAGELNKTGEKQEMAQGSPVQPSWVQQYLQYNEDKRLPACRNMLAGICKEILEVPSSEILDEEEGFFEIGFDSLMMTELATLLRKKLEPSLKIPATIGFDYPSINKLAQYIYTELSSQTLNSTSESTEAAAGDDDIAIIGMSCSFPKAPDLAAFETLLEQGLSGMQDIPAERWDNRKYYDPDKDAPGKSYVSKMGLIEGVKGFDANFFGISPREARLMDPQQRLFLECSYKALEHANYSPESLRGSLTGVFAGVGPNEYYGRLEKSGFSNEELSAFSITGNVLNLIPGRVAYTFDFKGPSLSIDTSCSSALVAIHYACNSLKTREVDYALAGGVNILLMPESNVTLCRAKALSPDGQCKTFDADADGYARGEGCGVIFLKRLADALRDKDSILAVIKGSAVNNDGKAAGLTVPNGKSQEAVMRKALRQTGLATKDISYIEAHGTGTPLGDPIEVHAIHSVYGENRSGSPLYLGSVKTNIGHLEAASGVAGVIKTVISLKNKRIYKHLNFRQLNPNIKVRHPDIALQTMDWPSTSTVRYAGVNSFGFSGTNAHLILQESPPQEKLKPAPSTSVHALLLSAKSPTALEKLRNSYQHYLAESGDEFGDICFTAATGRDHYSHRLVLTAENTKEASEKLQTGQFILTGKEHLLQDVNPALQDLLLLYLQGQSVDWIAYYQQQGGKFNRVKLPHYPFERIEFWTETKNDRVLTGEQMHPLLGQMLSLPDQEYLFNQKITPGSINYLEDYRLFGKMILPVAASIECGLAAARALFRDQAFCIRQFHMKSNLNIGGPLDLQLQAKPLEKDAFRIKQFAKQDEQWQEFSTMEIQASETDRLEQADIGQLKLQFNREMHAAQIYEKFKQHAFVYGDTFRVLKEAYVNADSLLAKISFDKTNYGQGYYYHPALLDGIMQSAQLLFSEEGIYLPYTFSRMQSFQEAPKTIWAYLSKREQGDTVVDIKLYDPSGLLFASIEGLRLKKVSRTELNRYEPMLQNLYETRWQAFSPQGQPNLELPEFWVIASDPQKAVTLLGDLNYRLVSEFDQLMGIADKHILFLYEQGQFYELLHCCQNLFRLKPQSFLLITENAHAIHDGEPVNPYHSMANAFWRTFRNELDFNRNYTIDLAANSDLPKALISIFSQSEENQFALREMLYVPRIKRKELDVHTHGNEMQFDSNSSCLITGGTGALAAALIDYLIDRGVKHIVITSRSPCPPAMQNLIEASRFKQVSIRHAAVDASNYQQMETLIKEIERNGPPLCAVFHLAGLIRDSLIVNINDEDLQAVLNSKMESALILHQLTKSLPLRYFVLFSSTASLLGARGQASYVAANGFLDGLAFFRKQQGLPALSINWGPFNAIGMTSKLTPGLQQFGFIPLEKDNLNVLDCLLDSQLSQIAVCRLHWDVYLKHSPRQIELSGFVKNYRPPTQYFVNALRQRSHAERRGILSRLLCEITADVLALDNASEIKTQNGLFSLGVDSLMSIEIRNRIHDKLQCPNLSLSIEYFINDPSIEKIADNIARELQIVYEQTDEVQTGIREEIEEIPLCDFQFSFWAINKLNYGYNTAMQLQLHGQLNRDYLIKAFDYVINQHEAFWLNFSPSVPTQTLARKGQFKLFYKDISLSDEPGNLHQEFYNNTARLIPLNKAPLIRVHLYKMNNDLHELHLVFPHIIVDDASCDIVFAQFRQCYEALAAGQSLPPIAEKESFLHYVKANNFQYQRDLDEKIAFWKAYNKDCSYLYFGPHRHLPDAAVYRPQHMFHFTINPQIQQVIQWHALNNLNISSGLIAICQAVFYQMSNQQKIPLILIHTGREGSQYKSTVGLFAEYKRINLDYQENTSFHRRVKAVEESLADTASYQKCPYFIKNTGIEGSRWSLSKTVLRWWNQYFLSKSFQGKVDERIVPYYLDYLSQIIALKISSKTKSKLNNRFKWHLPLQKPDGLKVLINITASWFIKEVEDTRFADLHYSFPSYFGGLDKPIGNQNLWVYFTRNAQGDYQLSINGPLTQECMAQIACRFNEVVDELARELKPSRKQA